MVALNFNAANVEPISFDVLPEGPYKGFIDQSEMRPTRLGGAMLVLRWNIITEGYKGRKVFQNLNIHNSNPVAQDIAFKQLSAVARACGVMMVNDTSQLHNIVCDLKLKVRKDPTGQYADQNDIVAVNPEGGAQMQAPAMAAPPMQAPMQPPAMPQAPQMPPAMQQPAMQPQMQAPMQQPPMQAPAQAAPVPAFMQQAAPQPVAQPAPQVADPLAGTQPAEAPWAAAPAQPWADQAAQAAVATPATASAPAAAPDTLAGTPAVQAAQTALPPWMQQPSA